MNAHPGQSDLNSAVTPWAQVSVWMSAYCSIEIVSYSTQTLLVSTRQTSSKHKKKGLQGMTIHVRNTNQRKTAMLFIVIFFSSWLSCYLFVTYWFSTYFDSLRVFTQLFASFWVCCYVTPPVVNEHLMLVTKHFVALGLWLAGLLTKSSQSIFFFTQIIDIPT